MVNTTKTIGYLSRKIFEAAIRTAAIGMIFKIILMAGMLSSLEYAND